ncbi:LysR family transcriptional regulator [Stenotrophomonas sp. Sa5BUN4]|uniref:LysR family transcriptional regulator n=2 Tax=Stenotrophomonas lacuserhaii TaxID=2760084 RepID=A0A8X8K2I7_9GAMM|nr:LysR family transcriptional regulator [Stenotrophomonas pennii]
MKRRMPTLNALKAFEVAGSTGNFTRAAERLHVTQSAVSRQVRLLEAQLGEPLLLRQHHHLQLTPAGKLLLQALQQSFDRIEFTVRRIQDQQHLHRLRLNVPPTFARRWLQPRLGSLRQAHPQLDLSLTTRLHDDLLESTRLDVAIRFGDGEWEGLTASHLLTEQHIAVCSPALATAHQRDGIPALDDMPLLHVLAGEDRRYLTWTHWLDAAGLSGIDLQAGHEFDVLDLAIQAAVDGLGVTLADRHMVAPQLADGTLVQVLDTRLEGHQSYWLVQRREASGSPALAAFCHWLQAEQAEPHRQQVEPDFFE